MQAERCGCLQRHDDCETLMAAVTAVAVLPYSSEIGTCNSKVKWQEYEQAVYLLQQGEAIFLHK